MLATALLSMYERGGGQAQDPGKKRVKKVNLTGRPAGFMFLQHKGGGIGLRNNQIVAEPP